MLKAKKVLLAVIALTLMTPVTLMGCEERTEVEVERDVNDTAPVVVPDRDVDVDVHTETQPAPNVIERETNTNTTIERDSSTGETKVDTEKSTTVH